ERPGRGRAALAGLAIGLATAVMYSGILLLAPAYLAGVLASPRRGLARLLPHAQLALVGLAAALAFLVTCPYLLLDFENARALATFATWAVYGTPEARPGAGWWEIAKTFVGHRAFGYHLACSRRAGWPSTFLPERSLLSSEASFSPSRTPTYRPPSARPRSASARPIWRGTA